MSSSARKVESFLLQERRKLIDSGVDRRSIKMRGSNLYVNGQLHGSVIDSAFVLSTVDSAPHDQLPPSDAPPTAIPTDSSTNSPTTD